jgi:hypothetical protein
VPVATTLATPRPAAAPTPTNTERDKFGPRKDAPGAPTPKPK